MMKLNSLNDVFEEQLGDLYDAEQQLVQALPKVAGAANSGELREALEHHLEQTRDHVRRLDEIFTTVGMTRPTEHCEAMEGLLKEGEKVLTSPETGVSRSQTMR